MFKKNDDYGLFMHHPLAHTKKSSGLDDLFKDYIPQQLEELKKIESSEHFAPVWQKYQALLSVDALPIVRAEELNSPPAGGVNPVPIPPAFPPALIPFLPPGWQMPQPKQYLSLEDFDQTYLTSLDEILSPSEINAFLQTTIAVESQENYVPLTGMFINKLMRNSYHAGFHDFVLDLQGLPLFPYLAALLVGTKENHYNIFLHGDVGRYSAYKSGWINLDIAGSALSECATYAWDSTVRIQQGAVVAAGGFAKRCEIFLPDDGLSVGYGSQDSTFHIHKNMNCKTAWNANFFADNAQGSTFIIEGHYLNDNGKVRATHCTFKALREDSLPTLNRTIYPGNRIVHIRSDGTEKIIRDYHEPMP